MRHLNSFSANGVGGEVVFEIPSPVAGRLLMPTGALSAALNETINDAEREGIFGLVT